VIVYHYFGLLFGRIVTTVALLTASPSVPGTHAAVWSGVSDPQGITWAQGGVERSYGDRTPYAYVETGWFGVRHSFHRWSVGFGDHFKVVLRHHLGVWTAVITAPGHPAFRASSDPVVILDPGMVSTLETLGEVSASAYLGGWIVYG